MDNKHEISKNQAAMGRLGMVLAFLIVAAVTIYADVMFIQVMWDVFPPGLMRIGGIVGALATGVSVIVLLIGKSFWFRPGDQLLAAWIFTGVEILVDIANILLAAEVAQHSVNSVLAMWQLVSPASPIIALIGWVILWSLDTSTKMRHAQLEIQEDQSISEMRYQKQVHQAQMTVKTQHLNQVAERLNTVINSPAVQAQIDMHAQQMVAKILTDVSGINAFIAPGAGARTVDSTLTPVSMAQIAPAPAPVAPAPVEPTSPPAEEEPKKKVDSEASGNAIPAPGGEVKTQTQRPNSKRRSGKQD